MFTSSLVQEFYMSKGFMRLVCNALGEILSERNTDLFDVFWEILLADITAAFEVIILAEIIGPANGKLWGMFLAEIMGILWDVMGGISLIRNYWFTICRIRNDNVIRKHGTRHN